MSAVFLVFLVVICVALFLLSLLADLFTRRRRNRIVNMDGIAHRRRNIAERGRNEMQGIRR